MDTGNFIDAKKKKKTIYVVCECRNDNNKIKIHEHTSDAVFNFKGFKLKNNYFSCIDLKMYKKPDLISSKAVIFRIKHPNIYRM